jgi:hypothetical protein
VKVRIALLFLVVVAVVVAFLSRRDPAEGPPVSTDAVRVGVAPMSSIPDYVGTSRAKLAALPAGDSYALVAFTTYVAPARLPELLAGTAAAEVVARVPLPGEQTEILRITARQLPDDVTAGMVRVAERKEREVVAYRSREASEQNLTGAADRAAAEAVELRAGCVCIYAAFVRASRDALVTLGTREGVRVVDPAPEVTDPVRTVLLPPLPDQTDLARPPSGR